MEISLVFQGKNNGETFHSGHMVQTERAYEIHMTSNERSIYCIIKEVLVFEKGPELWNRIL